ncbi:hypothetical protein ABZ835_12030 [Streptomyces sp. NPDC047461]
MDDARALQRGEDVQGRGTVAAIRVRLVIEAEGSAAAAPLPCEPEID